MNCNETKKQSITDTNKGIWIPREILQMELTLAQKITLALINQLSEGKQQAAWITNAQIAEITGIKEITIKNKVKPTLRKKGLISTVGICNTMHLKGDTNATEDKHLKGDTNGEQQNHDTNAMHLKGDTNETYLKGDTNATEDKHLKGDEDSTQKVIQNTKENITKLIITKPILIKRDDTSANNTVIIDEVEDIPEWMLEIPPTEPFEQYTDDVQATDTFHTEDEKPTDTVTDKVNNNTDSFGEIIADALQADEEEQTDLTQYEDVLPSDLSNPDNPFLGVPVDYLKADGTITHTDPESLSNRLKTTPVDLSTDKTETDTTNNNKNNPIPMELTLEERKAKQAEITQKWKNFIQQVPTMDRETADKYLNNFIVAANKYFTGEYIERITTQWREQFEFTAKPPFDMEQAKRIVQNGVNQYAEQNTIARTLYSIYCKPVNRQWLETTIAEAKQKRDAERNQYKPDGDLPF